jgi:hypothetical protein
MDLAPAEPIVTKSASADKGNKKPTKKVNKRRQRKNHSKKKR